MKIRIDVTQDDIANGVKASANLCPIARALKRMVVGPVRVRADNITLGGQTIYSSRRIRQFIRRFDANRHNVEPTTLYLKTN
jgi:hypothetical protein